jgi:hypothetical protein
MTPFVTATKREVCSELDARTLSGALAVVLMAVVI